MDIAAHVRAVLAALATPWEIMACDPALADTAAFCAHYGIAPEDSANTIVVVGARSAAAAALPGAAPSRPTTRD